MNKFSLPLKPVAVILPLDGVFQWHISLIDWFRRSHTVFVFVAPAKGWDWRVHFWMGLEHMLFKDAPLARRVPAPNDAQCFDRSLDWSDYRIVLDFARQSMGLSNGYEVRYDGMADDRYLLGKILRRRSPKISLNSSSTGLEVAASYPSIQDRAVLIRALSTIFSRTAALCTELLDVEPHGRRKPLELSTGAISIQPMYLLKFAIRLLAEKLANQVIKKVKRTGYWSIALRRSIGVGFPAPPAPTQFSIISTPLNSYLADPFIFRYENNSYLFAEEFLYSVNKGVLVCAKIGHDGDVGSFEVVLERPYHLSYPFIFEHDGQILMIPESGADGKLQLYRCLQFPGTWEFVAVLIEEPIADATLFQEGGVWWILGTVARFGGSIHDELNAYYSLSLTGPWKPHSANPIKSDCRSSRCAGKIVRVDGRLFRPAQNCETGYGEGLVWCEITHLTPTFFDEVIVESWPAEAGSGFRGLHTYNSDEQFDAIDLKWDPNICQLKSSLKSVALKAKTPAKNW
ncbi:glucosamine inositolphosphorylceramide transferase family protein [Phenylobacterium conjunctum]|uniref:Glucosamine inositolphosphorylceramide transferase 1 N-terminal domain-containing protein n=1 Tax=Phenylobacterium conjunctum TaxID=1298959 RepID=A0ABW3T6W3_9CAUL